MKISASVYSSKSNDLVSLVNELEEHGVEMLHIDCNDDPEVFNDIKRIREISDLAIDLHLISKEPETYFDLLSKNPVEYCTFQYEELQKPLIVPENIQGRLGLAITSGTDIEVFQDYHERFSFVLFMATTPGQSGGKFNKDNFKKIRKFRNAYPDKRIHVDGGVNAEVSFILRNMGVYAAVVGSYLFSEKIGAALLNLQSRNIDSHFQVKDFMREQDEVPLVKINEINLRKVLESIEEHKLAFTLVVGENNKLKGLISNADIRKGMLQHIDDLNQINVLELMNEHPIVIEENKTVMELLRFIKAQKVALNYLPVVNSNQEITGVVSFTNLIKGEL